MFTACWSSTNTLKLLAVPRAFFRGISSFQHHRPARVAEKEQRSGIGVGGCFSASADLPTRSATATAQERSSNQDMMKRPIRHQCHLCSRS